MFSLLIATGCSAFGIRSGTEQPPYTQVEQLSDRVDVRRYEGRLAADVVVDGDEGAARSAGFRKLAAFIFGENDVDQSISMTAPVSQSASTEIAMTAPVSQQAADGGQWRIRFFMPSQYTRETLPQPRDPDITIVELPPETYAVLRFSGSRTPARMHEATAKLSAVLEGSSWRAVGDAKSWFYDPPWTLWFLRRNEVAFPVEPG